MKKQRRLASLLGIAGLGLILSACTVHSTRPTARYQAHGNVQGTVAVGSATVYYPQSYPPEPLYETITTSPGYGYVWIDGYWHWNGYEWVWVSGRWVPGRDGYIYVSPYYDWMDGRYVYHAGYWAHRNRVPRGYRVHTHRNGRPPTAVRPRPTRGPANRVPPARQPPHSTPGRVPPPRSPGRTPPDRTRPPRGPGHTPPGHQTPPPRGPGQTSPGRDRPPRTPGHQTPPPRGPRSTPPGRPIQTSPARPVGRPPVMAPPARGPRTAPPSRGNRPSTTPPSRGRPSRAAPPRSRGSQPSRTAPAPRSRPSKSAPPAKPSKPGKKKSHLLTPAANTAVAQVSAVQVTPVRALATAPVLPLNAISR